MKRIVKSSNSYKGVTVAAKLSVYLHAQFDDIESDEETVRYLVEQDLEDLGYDVDYVKVEEGSVALHK